MIHKKILLFLIPFCSCFFLSWWITSPKRIHINIQDHELCLVKGFTIKTFPITTGSIDSPTRRGEFTILNKIENVESYHGYTFPHWLGIYEVGEYENGIHSVNGDNPWEQCLGNEDCTPGSVILSIKDMEYLYNWAEAGISVIISETTP